MRSNGTYIDEHFLSGAWEHGQLPMRIRFLRGGVFFIYLSGMFGPSVYLFAQRRREGTPEDDSFPDRKKMVVVLCYIGGTSARWVGQDLRAARIVPFA